jgi:hypothetical protein
MAENRVSAVLSSADREAVLAAIQTIHSKLPFLISLTPEQRKGMLKLGPKSVDFVNNALTVSNQNAQLLPPVFDQAEWQKDVELLTGLNAIATALSPLAEKIDDTLMVAGSEAYAAALSAYNYLKAANASGGLDGLLDDLGQRFARRSRTAATPK